jgi:uncharacterized protein (TIGR03067 family)
MLITLTCLLAVAVPGQPADKDGPAELQGTWKLVAIEIKGELNTLAERQPRIVIQGNKLLYGGENVAVLTAEGAAAPKAIDLTCLQLKRTYEGIYEVAKGTLRICLNQKTEGVKERPEGFTTKDKADYRLLVFERDKAAKPDLQEGLTGYAGVALRFNKDRKEIGVSSVLGGSPAKKAGLRQDDVILKIGGQAYQDLRTAVEAVRQARPGTPLVFRVARDGKESDITVTIGVLPLHWLVFLE